MSQFHQIAMKLHWPPSDNSPGDTEMPRPVIQFRNTNRQRPRLWGTKPVSLVDNQERRRAFTRDHEFIKRVIQLIGRVSIRREISAVTGIFPEYVVNQMLRSER